RMSKIVDRLKSWTVFVGPGLQHSCSKTDAAWQNSFLIATNTTITTNTTNTTNTIATTDTTNTTLSYNYPRHRPLPILA
ncbi:MAG TPA: hypothetical protein VHK69_14795, partial [Chitinophagaceae bacterium]|nr:hypothetical protein [Chitinophagaceae bacterium]